MKAHPLPRNNVSEGSGIAQEGRSGFHLCEEVLQRDSNGLAEEAIGRVAQQPYPGVRAVCDSHAVGGRVGRVNKSSSLCSLGFVAVALSDWLRWAVQLSASAGIVSQLIQHIVDGGG
jgi:hypothetical protein